VSVSFKPISEVYPDEAKEELERGSFYGPGDYQPLLESFGYEIALKVDDDDYQGDSRVLFLNPGNGQYGYLNFGWGSCSGCDALQACGRLADIETLRTELHDSIKWDTPSGLLDFFTTHDWKGDYCWHESGQMTFVNDAINYLRKEGNANGDSVAS
jgi:hypothetical protein